MALEINIGVNSALREHRMEGFHVEKYAGYEDMRRAMWQKRLKKGPNSRMREDSLMWCVGERGVWVIELPEPLLLRWGQPPSGHRSLRRPRRGTGL